MDYSSRRSTTTYSVGTWATCFWQAGFSVLPIRYGQKAPERDWKIYQAQRVDEATLHSWFGNGRHNWGVVTGYNGLVVLDFDTVQEYGRWVLWSSHQVGVVRRLAQSAYRVQTSRGIHVYLRQVQPVRSRKVGKVDVRGVGSLVVGAGSLHPSGTTYQALSDRFVFPLFQSLDQVLPAALLTTHTELAPFVTPLPLPPAHASTGSATGCSSADPWVMASGQVVGPDLVSAIRATFRLEEFFHERERTSDDGRWQMARCPLHDDHRPSLWIDTERQVCGCYAGCNEKPMDVINLYAALYGLSNQNAILELSKRLNGK